MKTLYYRFLLVLEWSCLLAGLLLIAWSAYEWMLGL